jgi:hypothetical protein
MRTMTMRPSAAGIIPANLKDKNPALNLPRTNGGITRLVDFPGQNEDLPLWTKIIKKIKII